ncbi:prephenate dehydrogenase [Phaffia rhodozyma]|uniref:prephenate dehydrogenase (NADP(+)) n=1 Tax=Phaffia rhodozyma TaxID=264483 RepID=A0A0F7SZ54_PHARH|nr:prephenate dehydrogenase [Phaffia rhodozyma]
MGRERKSHAPPPGRQPVLEACSPTIIKNIHSIVALAMEEHADGQQPKIGIIGMGDMGKMYARRLLAGGWTSIYACDLPEKFEVLTEEFKDTSLTILSSGHLVSRLCDFVLYSVEAAFMDKVVAEFGPSTKLGAIVSGQTSVKAPEKEAFEKHLPQDVHIISMHSLHGPTVSPEGQPMILIQHRAPDSKLRLVEEIFACFKSSYVYMTYEEHDLVTANTQAVTHAAFLSMGTAWHSAASYPWESGRYVGGIEIVKINIALRIYANKWHVYAGLAILNPSARLQINQYATSTTELFKLMIEGNEPELRRRILAAKQTVFPESASSTLERAPILLSDKILDQFSLGPQPAAGSSPRNSHLSLLAMVDCWHVLGIRPFQHLDLAATPVFRMWIGVAEYLFRDQNRLDDALNSALNDTAHRSDDTEFVIAARGWSQCVDFGSWESYRRRFERTREFFAPRFDEATKVGGEMIKTISASSTPSTYAASSSTSSLPPRPPPKD